MVQTARMTRPGTPNFGCGTSRRNYRNAENALFTGLFRYYHYTNLCIKNVVLIDSAKGTAVLLNDRLE